MYAESKIAHNYRNKHMLRTDACHVVMCILWIFLLCFPVSKTVSRHAARAELVAPNKRTWSRLWQILAKSKWAKQKTGLAALLDSKG